MMRVWTRRLTGAALALLVVFGTIGGLRAQQEPVAMVTDKTGEATTSVDGDSLNLQLLDVLAAGSRLDLADGAKVTLVYLDSGNEFVFAGPAEVAIGAEAAKAVSGAQGEQRMVLASNVRIEPVGMSQASVVMRDLRDRLSGLILSHPVDTKVLDPAPTFAWRGGGSKGETRYAVTIAGKDGSVLHQATTRDSSLSLPADKALPQGQPLSWSVKATIKGKTYEKSAGFSIATEDTRARAESLKPGDGATFSQRVVYATLLENLGLNAAAKDIWRDLAAERPDDPSLRMMARSR